MKLILASKPGYPFSPDISYVLVGCVFWSSLACLRVSGVRFRTGAMWVRNLDVSSIGLICNRTQSPTLTERITFDLSESECFHGTDRLPSPHPTLAPSSVTHSSYRFGEVVDSACPGQNGISCTGAHAYSQAGHALYGVARVSYCTVNVGVGLRRARDFKPGLDWKAGKTATS